MLILVTGATGFVGRRVVKALAEAGHTVRALVHTPRHAAIVLGPGVELAHGHVLDEATLEVATRGAEGVVHLVAIIRQSRRHTFHSINQQGTANVVEAARKAGVSHLLHMSAIGAADNRRFPYLRSKWLGEQAMAGGGVPYTILRGSVLFGEGDELFNALAAVARALPVMPVAGNGKARFQPLAVEDVAECVVRVFRDTKAYQNRLIEIGGPHQFTYEQLLDVVQETVGGRRPRVHVPLAAMRTFMGVLGVLLPRPPATGAMLDMLAIDNITGLDAVEKNFGFTPRPVRGNIDYVRRLTHWDSLRSILGFMPTHVRDH